MPRWRRRSPRRRRRSPRRRRALDMPASLEAEVEDEEDNLLRTRMRTRTRRSGQPLLFPFSLPPFPLLFSFYGLLFLSAPVHKPLWRRHRCTCVPQGRSSLTGNRANCTAHDRLCACISYRQLWREEEDVRRQNSGMSSGAWKEQPRSHISRSPVRRFGVTAGGVRWLVGGVRCTLIPHHPPQVKLSHHFFRRYVSTTACAPCT